MNDSINHLNVLTQNAWNLFKNPKIIADYVHDDLPEEQADEIDLMAEACEPLAMVLNHAVDTHFLSYFSKQDIIEYVNHEHVRIESFLKEVTERFENKWLAPFGESEQAKMLSDRLNNLETY